MWEISEARVYSGGYVEPISISDADFLECQPRATANIINQIEFVKDKKTKEPFDPKLGVGALVQNLALSPKYSISLYTGSGTIDGKSGDHIQIAPAYNTTKEDIEVIADLTARVIEEVFSTMA